MLRMLRRVRDGACAGGECGVWTGPGAMVTGRTVVRGCRRLAAGPAEPEQRSSPVQRRLVERGPEPQDDIRGALGHRPCTGGAAVAPEAVRTPDEHRSPGGRAGMVGTYTY
jgi:hypothetical protein